MNDKVNKLKDYACELKTEKDNERRIIIPVYVKDVNENLTYRINGYNLKSVS